MDELDEPVLPDNYPMYPGYLYIGDGQVVQCMIDTTTVGEFKRYMSIKEIRRCDIVGRQKRIKEKNERKNNGE